MLVSGCWGGGEKKYLLQRNAILAGDLLEQLGFSLGVDDVARELAGEFAAVRGDDELCGISYIPDMRGGEDGGVTWFA